jgi:hypothetical protein
MPPITEGKNRASISSSEPPRKIYLNKSYSSPEMFVNEDKFAGILNSLVEEDEMALVCKWACVVDNMLLDYRRDWN